jgi:hypothetical protein
MRKFRGGQVCPVVTLSNTFMNTKFGGRQRPHLVIKRWIALGGGEQPLPAPEAAAGAPGVTTVEEPSLAEQMDDEIPPFDDPPDIVPKQPDQPTRKGVKTSTGRR